MTFSKLVRFWVVGWAAVCVALLATMPGKSLGAADAARPPASIALFDANGMPVPENSLAPKAQIVDVAVGANGSRQFVPNNITVSVGDTVRWTWQSDNHSVTSGPGCTADGEFCSPNNSNCSAGVLNNTGTVYQHTFTQTGTFSYFCALHCGSGMVGTVNVVASCLAPPAGMTAWFPGDGNAREIQNARSGTMENGATFAAGLVGQAFSFDGVDDDMVVRAASTLDVGTANGFTVDAWVNPTTTNSDRPVVEWNSGSIYGAHLWISVQSQGGVANNIYANLVDTNGTNHIVQSTAGVMTANSWQHIALTYDKTTGAATLYRNGAVVGQANLGTFTPQTSYNLYLGKRVAGAGTGASFAGAIDEVELFSRALSQSEVQAIFNAGALGKCKAPQPSGAISRRTHGAAGTFDVDLTPNGPAGIECRSTAGGNYQMIVQFPDAVTVGGASVIGVGTVAAPVVSGASVTLNLSNVGNAQTLVVKLTGVSNGALSGDVPIAMGVLAGDTNGTGSVSASDISQVKGQSGQAVTGTNFRTDVNVSGGAISASDIGLVKSFAGTQLP